MYRILNFTKNKKIVDLFYFILIAYISYFYYSIHFGLYEDDYWSIACGYNLTFKNLTKHFVYIFANWPTGRPLNHFIPLLLGYISKYTGIHALYVFGSLILGLNTYLVFKISTHITDRHVGILSSFIFLFYPCDTTRQLLVHIGHVQSAYTCILLAIYIYIKYPVYNKYSYILATICLLMYETPILLFILFPLLELANKSTNIRKLIIHFIKCLSICIVILLLRKLLSDTRTLNLLSDPKLLLGKSIYSCYAGPLTIIKSYINAIILGSQKVVIESFIALVLMVLFKYKYFIHAKNLNFTYLYYLILLFIISVSYTLTWVNFPPTQLTGRFTTTHLVASFPISLLIALMINNIQIINKYIRYFTYISLFIISITLINYSFIVQKSYIKSWEIQKNFWNQVFHLCPDIDETKTVMVIGSIDESNKYSVIMSNSWADYYACRSFIESKNSVDNEPGLNFGFIGAVPEVLNFVINENHEIVSWAPRFWEQYSKNILYNNLPYVNIKPDKLIILISNKGVLRRVFDININLNNSYIKLHSISDKSSQNVRFSKLYKELFVK